MKLINSVILLCLITLDKEVSIYQHKPEQIRHLLC